MFDTSFPVPRSEGNWKRSILRKLRLHRLSVELDSIIEFAKPGEIHERYAPESLYVTSREGRKIKKVVTEKKPAEAVYTGGRPARWIRDPEKGLQRVEGRVRGVPAYATKVLRPAPPGKPGGYATPGMQWVTLPKGEKAAEGERTAGQPIYKKKRLDTGKYLKTKFAIETAPIRAKMLAQAAPEEEIRQAEKAAKHGAFEKYRQAAQEEAQIETGRRLSAKKDIMSRMHGMLESEMQRHRDWQAAETRESRAIIRTRGASLESAAAHPERMINYKKKLEELTTARQATARASHQKAVEKIRGIAARGLQKMSGYTEEEALGKARRSVGILTDIPYYKGGLSPGELSPQTTETLSEIFQKGSRTGKPVTGERLRALKGKLDIAYERGDPMVGRGAEKVKALKSELFKGAPEVAAPIKGYPHLKKLGIGLGAAGLIGAGAGALYARHKRRQQQFSSKLKEIRFAELPPDIIRTLDKFAKQAWEQANRPTTIIRSPRIRRQMVLTRYRRMVNKAAVEKIMRRPDLPSHPNAPTWKGMAERRGEKIRQMAQEMRTRAHLAEESAKTVAEGHKEALGQIHQKGFEKGHVAGREAELLRGRTVREEQAQELTKKLRGESDVRARRLKWGIAGGVAAGGVGGYALGRSDRNYRRRLETQFSAIDKIRSQLSGQSEDTTAHDVTIGAIEGGLAYPASEYLFKKFAPKGSGIGRKIFAGGVVGGTATGLVGLTLAQLQKKRRQTNMSSKAHPIQFESQRTLVARDRYIKQIHERDVARANRAYIHAGAIGAGIGLLARKKAPLSRAILTGAATGIGAQKAARIYGYETRDPFGERTVWGKRVERAPNIAGGAILAGYGLKHLLKHSKFSAKQKLIQFQNDQYQDPEWLQKWAHKRLYGRDYATKGQVQKIKKYLRRSGGLIRDINIKRQGLPNVDVRGRPRTPEWQKPWVAGALTSAALGAAYLTGKKGIKFIRGAPLESRIGQLREGFLRGDVGKKIPGLQKVGGFVHDVKSDIVRWRDKPLHEKPKFDVSKFNPETGKPKSPKTIEREETVAATKAELEKRAKGKVYKTDFRSKLKEIRFAQTLSQWEISHRSPGSAVVHAPESQRRQRREKTWAERKANQRLLWEGGLSALALAGGGGALYARSKGLRVGFRKGVQATKVIGSTGRPVKYAEGEQLRHVWGPFAVVEQKPKRVSTDFSIKFEEPKRKHNIAAGLTVAAAGLPIYKGAAKFARIGLRPKISQFTGESLSHGKQVVDYLEASQHLLNQGITGKLTGLALRHPKAPIVKRIMGRGPSELGSSKSGINKLTREHYSAFRSSPTEALDAWAGEVHAKLRPGIQQTTHLEQYNKLQSHLSDLWSKGYNEREALRHAATDPRHEQLFRRLNKFKAGPTKIYQKVTAGLAAVPAGAGAAVAATTRKNANGSGGR